MDPHPDSSTDTPEPASPDAPRRAADGHTFVSYASEDSPFVHPLATYLRARGISMWLDLDIPVGADWDSTIDAQLRSCRNFLIVLSPAAVASEEVRGELRMALDLAKPIVPVLYRSCDIPRRLKNVEYLDVRSADNADTAREALAAFLLSTPRGTARKPRLDRVADRDRRTRQDFLDEVKREALARLAQSIHTGTLNIRKERQPDQVARRWDGEVKIPQHQRTPLGPDTRIVDLLDEEVVAGKLLILGAPGSGKTTALLEVALELITRAEDDGSQPMPFLCNLSSWREDGRALAAWLVDYLRVKYGVRKDHGHTWQNERLLIPLLDGLDEVVPEHQEACLAAINGFQQELRPRKIIVCCRLSEYRTTARSCS